MTIVTKVILVLAALVSVYSLIVAVFTLRAIRKKRYEAYRQKVADFNRLNQDVLKAFEEFEK